MKLSFDDTELAQYSFLRFEKEIGVFQPFVGSPGLRMFVRAIGPFSVFLAVISPVRLLGLFVRSYIIILSVRSFAAFVRSFYGHSFGRMACAFIHCLQPLASPHVTVNQLTHKLYIQS